LQLIIGGAYQGKKALAKEKYAITENDIEVCTAERVPEFSRKCISHIENFALYCVKNGLEAKNEIAKYVQQLKDKVILANDMSCGVVPIDKTDRLWREETGRVLSFLAQQADEVSRVFCGIEQVLKGGNK